MANYFITTSIPYVNADPHIGFALEIICADVLARRAIELGNSVIFSTGTDEHGGKIAEKAAESNLDTKVFTDVVSQKYRNLTKDLNISNNRFIRTTDDGHEERAQLIWKTLDKDIYKGKYSGWYCTGDEAFIPEIEVKANNGVCPIHNRKYEKIQEDNYFFKLSSYSKQIYNAIYNNEVNIIPGTRKNEILSLIKGGLSDISVSRPKDKITWGIPVPSDPTQVMYVWFEALMNYITVLGYPENKDFKNFWPADVHVIGKDILRFHAAIWPAMLLSLKIDLPKNIYVHGFITSDGQKMSKSIGNVVSPESIVKKYGADALRFYLLKHIPSYDDGDFTMDKFVSAYNNELANELGNALKRTVSMISNYQAGKIGKTETIGHDLTKFNQALENCQFDRAMNDIWDHVRGLNQYIDEEKPWELAKNKDSDHLREVLAYQVSSLLFIANLLKPFLPETSDKIFDTFKNNQVNGENKVLFPKFEEVKTKNIITK